VKKANVQLNLCVSIMAALAAVPVIGMAGTAAPAQAANPVTMAGLNTNEMPRVTKVVTMASTTTVPRTHLNLAPRASAVKAVDDSLKMKHLQLVLKPSAQRQAALEKLIAGQHDPQSPTYRKWLTPQQYGESFGLVDADIATVTAWLEAQGFTVNSVYPNKTQIDFSGTAGQVRHAFTTNEMVYTINGEKHLSNDSDIRIPVALQSVVAGVMGLNDFHPRPLHTKPQIARWNAGKQRFMKTAAMAATSSKAKAPLSAADKKLAQAPDAPDSPDAVNFTNGARGLVPGDLATMYGVDKIRKNGVTGKGVKIAVVDSYDMVPADWTNFVQNFHLDSYGGSFSQTNPAPPSGANNCLDPDAVAGLTQDNGYDDGETLLDAEYATAIAPGATIQAAICSSYDADFNATTDNFFGGVFIAASNLINGASRPDIISASYGFGEGATDSASKQGIDAMWAQADAEGISVFVSTGDSGSNPDFNGSVIYGNSYDGTSAVDANSFATSPHVTAVGGTDTADVLDGTSSQYFKVAKDLTKGSALSYVPEIPWNESCGNEVAAKSEGYNSNVKFCKQLFKFDTKGLYATSEAGSGGPSSVDRKPAWQSLVFNAAKDQTRDLPDVSLFAGSYGGYTFVVTCTSAYPCTPDFSGSTTLSGGTSLSSPMFAGMQALIDQKMDNSGQTLQQGNAAPTLYALAAAEFGGPTGTAPGTLAACNADNGATGTDGCVFHNVTRGSISTNCYEQSSGETSLTNNCFFLADLADYSINTIFGPIPIGAVHMGLTSTVASPTGLNAKNEAYTARPGWSFASGLGSVNAGNLVKAWVAYAKAKK
jgi:subtilase family serine protease